MPNSFKVSISLGFPASLVFCLSLKIWRVDFLFLSGIWMPFKHWWNRAVRCSECDFTPAGQPVQLCSSWLMPFSCCSLWGAFKMEPLLSRSICFLKHPPWSLHSMFSGLLWEYLPARCTGLSFPVLADSCLCQCKPKLLKYLKERFRLEFSKDGSMHFVTLSSNVNVLQTHLEKAQSLYLNKCF